ncbi:gliding motility protein RemB [Flavobacterium sp.]|uniref:gliding motility protein RemB n=1 Tax=Flavobacterium sp. TaxID=239 RepID=UPI0038FD2D34
MKKALLTLFLFFYTVFNFAQDINSPAFSPEHFPVFPNCASFKETALENCFFNEVQLLIFQNFQVPENLKQNNFKGEIKVLFEVNKKGEFKMIYASSEEESLIQETQTIFNNFPKIEPSAYNGNPTYSRFTVVISIPLKDPQKTAPEIKATASIEKKDKPTLTELDAIIYNKFKSPQFQSHLNIPFSHSYYSQFDAAINQVGFNNHTGSKPYAYAEVSKYYDLASEYEKIKKKTSGWWTRKLWNESLVEIQGDGYWFTLNPILDMQGGNANGNKNEKTFINTRGINFRGGLGTHINFTTTVFESQGRFANYFNRYAESIKPDGGNPAIIPGMGIAKPYKTGAYDFPLAEANLTFSANEFFDLQLGYGRNFIGDGYRSLLVSDGASPYPYFKINTKFWKIKYTNTYTWLKDVQPQDPPSRTYAKKYIAHHYLSWNVSNKVNLGFFESVIWSNNDNRGFDMSFANPIIFYRSVEFASSSRTGNAMLGMTAKYKWNNQLNFYAQFLLDEFSVGDIQAGEKSWKNKFGYQLGMKYYNAFHVDNLLLQLEYNQVRPYVYSHSDAITNYGHNNQGLGHQWGANFKEFIFIARYNKRRYFADFKLTSGVRGLDFADSGVKSNYGGNIYRDYVLDRFADSGVTVGQGNKTTVFITDLQAGYLINPATNLKLFGSFIYRNFDPSQNTLTTFKESTTWFSLGIRSDVFNWYFDY